MKILRIPQATSKGYVEVPIGGCFDGSFPGSKTRRGRVQGGATFVLLLWPVSRKFIFLRVL